MSELHDDLLHIDDAARLLQRSTRTVRRLVAAGVLERHVIGGRAYVTKESVEGYRHQPRSRQAETIAELREHVGYLQYRVDILERALGILHEVEDLSEPPAPLSADPGSDEIAKLKTRLVAIHRRTS